MISDVQYGVNPSRVDQYRAHQLVMLIYGKTVLHHFSEDRRRLHVRSEHDLHPAEKKDQAVALPSVEMDCIYGFEVRLTPRYSVTKGGKWTKQPISAPVEQLAWFMERTSRWGFLTERESVTVRGCVRPIRRPKGHYFMNDVLFRGVLQVIDVEKMEECLAGGIGTDRGMGHGLLLLERDYA